MNDHKALVVGGEPVSVFLERSLPGLVPAVIDKLVADVPVYGRLPRELIEADVSAVVRHAVSTFAGSLAAGGTVPPDALEQLGESALRRAEEGVPMDMVLAAYFHGSSICLEVLQHRATERDLADVLQVTLALIRFMQAVTSAVAAGYSRHNRTVVADQASTRQLLLNALLEGADVELAAGRAGLRLPGSYAVMSVVAGTHVDEADPGVEQQVATQRKLRRLRGELERHFADLLWMPGPEGGLGLTNADGASDRKLATVRRSLELVTGVEVHIGLVVAACDDVPAAARTAREVSDVAQRLGRPGGVYQLRDVALEYQLTRSSPARPMLADLLAPLRGQDQLVTTLRAYLASGHSRRQTATALGVHPNTVDNRLKRTKALTGLDPLRAMDLPLITAALAASAAAAGEDRDSAGP